MDVDKQRMVIAPILRLVFSLTSLVDTSEFFEVTRSLPIIMCYKIILFAVDKFRKFK